MTSTIARPPRQVLPRRRRVRWQTVARYAALPMVLVVVAIYLLGFSPVVGVRTVRVTGTELLTEQQVLDVATVKQGTPLLRLDTGRIEARLRLLPQVASVRVRTHLPATVTIAVTERTAVGYVALGASFEVYDRADVGFRQVATSPRTVPQLVAGSQPGGPESLAAAQVAGAIPHSLLSRVKSVAAPTTESVTLVLADGRIVLWGGTDRDADKARLLPVLLKQPGRYFDVSDPDAVVSRPAA